MFLACEKRSSLKSLCTNARILRFEIRIEFFGCKSSQNTSILMYLLFGSVSTYFTYFIHWWNKGYFQSPLVKSTENEVPRMDRVPQVTHYFDELSEVAQMLSWSIMCAETPILCASVHIVPHRRPSKRRVRMSGEEDPRDGGIDDSISDDCNVAGTCAADIESEVLRLSPMRSHNLPPIAMSFSEMP
jgi:hypothetical protein